MGRAEATVLEAFAAAGKPLPPYLFGRAFQDRDDVERMNHDNRARIERLRAEADQLRATL